MTHRDPTSEAAERNEELPCMGCLWRQWDAFSLRAWCDHDFWIGNELLRPQTDGVNPMRRCARYEEPLTSSVFHMRKDDR